MVSKTEFKFHGGSVAKWLGRSDLKSGDSEFKSHADH